MNCVERYFRSEFCHDTRPAIVFFDGISSLNNEKKTVSFQQLTRNAIRAQVVLRNKGLGKGDAVLLFESPSPNMYAMLLGMLALGIRIMLVEPWMPLKKIDRLIQSVGPKGFMAGRIGKMWGLRSRQCRKIEYWFTSGELQKVTLDETKEVHIERMDPDDNAIMTFTSGTSGNPKGVHRRHKFLIDQAAILRKYLRYDGHPKLDLTIFTNVALLNLGLGKGSLLIPPRWPKGALKDLDKLGQDYQVDTLAAGPAFLAKLMRFAKASSLQSFHMGGALADCDLYEKAFSHWPEAKFTHVYGSSEAEPIALCDLKVAVAVSKEKGRFQTLFLGRPVEEVKLELHPNELWVTGPNVAPLYEGDEEANRKNKRLDANGVLWHNMGDRVSQDDQGLWYQGRSFQKDEDFRLEQEIYQKLQHSKCFVHRVETEIHLVGELSSEDRRKIDRYHKKFEKIINTKIYRDKRHRSRIDRKKTLKKAGYEGI